MLCDLGLHRVDPAIRWNGGIGFSRCLRCRSEIVRRSGRPWTRVPRGYAVVWRAAPQDGPCQPAAEPPRRLARLPLDALAPPRELASRSYRYLVRRIAARSAAQAPIATILVSGVCGSDAANETTLLLAAMMQDELGGRLLLVDATLRGDGIGAMLGALGTPGLSEARAECLVPPLNLVRPLHRDSQFMLGPGLHPAATRSEEMAAVLPVLARHFDHVLIQQHAITADTRYLALASRADLVLVVAEEGRSSMAALADCRETFRSNRIDNVGLILSVPRPQEQRHGG